ncbi:MAG TPA: glycosyltransferase family 4 protein, partial [Geminicoccaceae bacterium]|nr:glycosyltransferase family 4 protein [Geminicoccaceae bacterium]
MHAIPRLAEQDLTMTGPVRPLRVCVVTSEILGPVKNGGIGAATSGLVEHLVRDGHRVTVLYTLVEYGTPVCVEQSWVHWVETLAAAGIELVHLPHRDDYRAWRRKSWLVKEFLGQQEFDLVYFNEHHGSGYYTLAAKRAGLAPFSQRVHCVITHGSIAWVFDTNDQPIGRASDLEMIGLERRSVEWADVVIGPSEYLLREYERYGWRLPPRTFRQPYPLSLGSVVIDTELQPVDELVFFGRLEVRKGLWLFCDALDRLAEALRGRTVTFMGRSTEVAGIPSAAFVLARAARWPFRVRLLTGLGQEEALAYLTQPGRVAVMPSLADNSPCVIYECMERRVPFLAASGSGADELVHPDCWPRVMVEPTVDALAGRLARLLDEGAGLGWPGFDAAANLRTWSAWHRALAARCDAPAAPAPDAAAAAGTPGAGDAADLLLVTLDGEGCSLALLTDHLSAHIERFGAGVRHLLLTTRRGPVQDLLAEILDDHAAAFGTSVRILDPDQLEPARDDVLAADIVLFADAGHELLASFFAAALAMLARRGAAAVSCMVAERQGGSGKPEIMELPCGDLPGAGGLGLPIGSGVWAAATAELRDELEALPFHHADSGELASAAALAQSALHKALLAGKPFRLLPTVGALRTREAGAPGRRRHWYGAALEAAANLGVAPGVHPDAAPWLAVLSSGARHAPERDRIAGAADLPEGHPLRRLPHTGHDLEGAQDLAAALGRPDQAAQLGLADGMDGERIAALLALAEQAVRARPVLDLGRALGEAEPRRLGGRAEA